MTVILKKGFSNLKYHNNSNQYNPREAIDLDNKRNAFTERLHINDNRCCNHNYLQTLTSVSISMR